MTIGDTVSAGEIAGREEIRDEAYRLLSLQLEYVMRHSGFYQRKFAGLVVSPERLAELPFTTKDEVRAAEAEDPPFGPLRAADQSEIVRLHVTSGTTGRPVSIGFTERDLRMQAEIGGRAFRAAGLGPDDTMLHCLNYSFYVGGLADHAAAEWTGALIVPVGLGQSERILDLWPDLRPTAIYGTPSYARHLARVAEGRGIDVRTLGLRILLVAGEPGGDVPEIRDALTGLWNAEVGDVYGLGEVWPAFGGQCEAHDGIHLTAFDGLWYELIDPETEDTLPWEPGVRGEMVLTHLQREATPLVRYRTRDLVEILDERCACGRTLPRARILGRSDAMFIVRGVNVFPQAIQSVLDQVMPRHGPFAVLLEDPHPVPPLRLLIEMADGSDDAIDVVRRAIRERLQFSCEPELHVPGSLGIASEAKAQTVFRTYQGEWPPGLRR